MERWQNQGYPIHFKAVFLLPKEAMSVKSPGLGGGKPGVYSRPVLPWFPNL